MSTLINSAGGNKLKITLSSAPAVASVLAVVSLTMATVANDRQSVKAIRRFKYFFIFYSFLLDYLSKAKTNLELCDFYKEKGFDYKIPEEWFYTLYYCALAILSKFGIESRSQKCTAIFLRYARENKLIEYDLEFIDRITVHSSKDEKSDVDERENARYSSEIESKEIEGKYDYMVDLCKKAIFQTEEIVFSNKEFKIPEEIKELLK